MQQTPVTPVEEPNRPAVEALTPPSISESPASELGGMIDLDASIKESAINSDVQVPIPGPALQAGHAGDVSYGPGSGSMSSGSSKKRKLNDEDEFADLGEGDLDADVAEMLRQDSGTV